LDARPAVPFLNTGVIKAVFHVSGTAFTDINLLNMNRVPTDLENLEKSGSLTNREKSGKSKEFHQKSGNFLTLDYRLRLIILDYLNGRMPGKQDQ